MRCPYCNQKATQQQLLYGAYEKEQAKVVLAFLNSKRPWGRGFRPTIGNLKYIIKRLKDGYVEQDFFSVIALKVRQNKEGKFGRQYLRPETLFGEKFDRYVGELGSE